LSRIKRRINPAVVEEEKPMARDPKSEERPQSQVTGGWGQSEKKPEPVVKVAFEWRMLKKIEHDKYRKAMTEAELSDSQRMTEEEFDKAMSGAKAEKSSGKAEGSNGVNEAETQRTKNPQARRW
jgi:hypothetical protein